MMKRLGAKSLRREVVKMLSYEAMKSVFNKTETSLHQIHPNRSF